MPKFEVGGMKTVAGSWSERISTTNYQRRRYFIHYVIQGVFFNLLHAFHFITQNELKAWSPPLGYCNSVTLQISGLQMNSVDFCVASKLKLYFLHVIISVVKFTLRGY